MTKSGIDAYSTKIQVALCGRIKCILEIKGLSTNLFGFEILLLLVGQGRIEDPKGFANRPFSYVKHHCDNDTAKG
jgi:hypothetical protein